jgi:cysteine-rich repeat protein
VLDGETEQSLTIGAPRIAEDGYITGVGDGGAAAPSENVHTGATPGGNGLVVIRYFSPATCGDGIVGPGEACDDGNTLGGDECSACCDREIDLDWDSVALLLHLDSDFMDVSYQCVPTTAYSGAALSSQQSAYGLGAAEFDNNSSILITSPVALGAGDFTVELWAYPRSFEGEDHVFYVKTDSEGGVSTQFYLANSTPTLWGDVATQGPPTVQNAWNHLAFVRHQGNVTVYTNGVGGGSLSAAYDFPAAVLSLGNVPSADNQGAYNPIHGFDGFLDEVRVTVGVARYTANFAVPTRAFPDEGPAR